MIYGRVIGNELRDVPPEYLPIWGQRWSGYHAPQGPSPFSTHIFSADQMSEIGPALTSPAQFEATLTEEDEGEDETSEPNRFYGSFVSPLAVKMDATDLMYSPKRPTSQSSRRSSSLGMPRRSDGYSPPGFNSMFPKSFYEHSEILQHPPDPLLHTLTSHYGIPMRGGRTSFGSHCTSWDAARPSVNVQPPVGPPHRTSLTHSISDWQSVKGPTQSPTYPSHPGNSNHLSQQSRTEDLALFIATAQQSPSRFCTIPLPQQIVEADLSWDRELSTSTTPSVAHPQIPTVAQWSSAAPPSQNFLGSLHDPKRLAGAGIPHDSVSDCHPSHPEDSHDMFVYADDCTLLPFDNLGGGQFTPG